MKRHTLVMFQQEELDMSLNTTTMVVVRQAGGNVQVVQNFGKISFIILFMHLFLFLIRISFFRKR